MGSRAGFLQELASDLKAVKAKQIYRSPEIFSSKTRKKRLGRCIDFSSNDYLGLSHHPKVIAAAIDAIRQWGTGSGASRLLSGNLKIHTDLEKEIARLKKEQSASVFSSGYLANLGILKALAGPADAVVLDRLAHASLIDGARLSGAKLKVYNHCDPDHLTKVLDQSRALRRRVVVTESYFSMDGDVAPLDAILDVCRKKEAILVIDEAHATGVFGKNGAGLTEEFQLEGRGAIVVGTLSKALGSVGGFVAGSRLLRESLVNFCRPYIYTTAPSPAGSAAALASLHVLETEKTHRVRLEANVKHLRDELKLQGWDLMRSQGPIIPVLVGDSKKVLKYKKHLLKKGFVVSAIRPPSVGRGTDRLRISASAAHSTEQVSALLKTMATLRRRSA